MLDVEQCADLGDPGLTVGTGQKAIMTDTVEAGGQDVDQEPADKLGRCQPHDFVSISRLDAVILPAKLH